MFAVNRGNFDGSLPETSAQMREILGKVVEEDGTGTQARIKGSSSAGKRGRRRRSSRVGPVLATKRTASFVGFPPLNDPKLLSWS